MATEDIPIRLAATVVILRDGAHGPELLLVQRASELAFHGGAWVFPGGRVDAEDFADARAWGELPEPGTLAPREALDVSRRAAVREAREESGLVLDPDRLVPFAHWTTPRGRPRRFATWFFAIELDRDDEVVIDGGEIRAHKWLRPSAAIEARALGELELPPPTFVTLSVLAPYGSCVAVLSQLARGEPPIYVPRPHIASHGVISLYHGDVAYEGGEVERAGPRHRLNMLQSGWSYQHTLG